MNNSISSSSFIQLGTRPYPSTLDTLLLQVSYLHRRLDVQSNTIDLLTSTIVSLQQRLVKTAYIVDQNHQSSAEDHQSLKSAVDALPDYIDSLRCQCLQNAQRTDLTLQVHAKAIAQTHAYLSQQAAYKAMLSTPILNRPQEQLNHFAQGAERLRQEKYFQLQHSKMHSRKRPRIKAPDDDL